MKVLVETFGCRANQYDSEHVKAMVTAGGGEIVYSAADADVAVYNSCAVTAQAEADLRQRVRRGARANPRIRSVIMGCASGLELARPSSGAVRSLTELPTVERLIPGADIGAVAGAIGVSADGRGLAQSGARGLLRIQDGCNEHCTFCATTIARGVNRSRPAEALIEEAVHLADTHSEIVITGIHIGSYGTDIGSSLSLLAERLIAGAPGARFRLSSLEATEVDDRLVELYRGAGEHLAPYLHAPLQSGSDRVLKRMGRHWYTSESYARAIERIVDGHEFFGLGADVIAGFPGETEEDHRATVRLVESLPFTSLHVFPYSPRPGTAAPKLTGAVHPSDVSRRARELRAVATAKADAYRLRMTGTSADVVVIREAGTAGVGQGLTGDYLMVAVDDPRLLRGERFSARLQLDGERLVAHKAKSE